MLLILVLFMMVFCACAVADTEYVLEPCAGKMSLNEANYIVLTPENLDDHQDLLSSPAISKTKEDLLADWEENHVLLQAWTKKMDACLEVPVFMWMKIPPSILIWSSRPARPGTNTSSSIKGSGQYRPGRLHHPEARMEKAEIRRQLPEV